MESNPQLHLRRSEPRIAKNLLPPYSITAAPIATTALPSLAVDDQLTRLERLAGLGALSAGLAHEIKNAMVAVRTFVDILLAENKNAELAAIVQRELLRIDSIVSKMLRCASNPKPHLARVSLHEILERSVGLIEPQLRARKI